MRRLLSALALPLLSVGLNARAMAQGIITGSISGTVVDSSGAVVPGATITAKDLSRGTTFNTHAAGDGNFSFQSLPIGAYGLSISQAGFSDTKVPRVTVDSGVDHGLGKEVLNIGATNVQVEVESNSAQLETTQSQVSVSFDTQQLESLPLNNGFDEVALLEPGVASAHDLNDANTNGASLSSNGARGRSNNFELDGQSNNDNSVSGPQVFFGNQDAIAEIQVVQTNFSAQYGRNTGTVVNYITKSGTNQIHGSAFEFWEGDFLQSYTNQEKTPLDGYCTPGENAAATGCTPVAPLPRYVDNRFGGTIGAPVIKDKLFAFGSAYFERTRYGSEPFVSSATNITPTPTGLATLAAAFPGNAAVAALTNFGPYGVKLGNPQPVLSEATTVNVTTPTGTVVPVQYAPVTRSVPGAGAYNDEEVLGRLDWQASPKDRLFVRYLYQNTLSENEPDAGPNGIFYNVPAATHSVGADYTRSITQNLVNQVRYSFQQSKLDFQGGSYPNCTVNTLTSCPGFFEFEDSEMFFGEADNLPQGRTVKVTQVQDNVSFSRGRHTLLFGGEYDLQNSPNIFLPNYNGTVEFGSLQNALTQTGPNGEAVFGLATGNPVLGFKENDFAFYGQDNLKVSQGLTLNIGLRWEFFGQAINLLHNETVARESNPATAIWSTALPLSARTVGYVNPDYTNFEPRVGFAYNPPAFPKTVLRGGYSVGYDPAFYNIFLNAAEDAPVADAASFACAGTCLGNGNFVGSANRAVNLPRLPLGGNPAFSDQEYVPAHFHNPYLETYSLGIEQQVGSRLVGQIRYVGSHGVGNFQALDANPQLSQVAAAFPNYPLPSLCTDATAPGYQRPNCNLSNYEVVGNTSFTIYNSLQTQMTMREFHGFTGTVNYTFSHAIDNASEVYSSSLGGGQAVNVPQNPLDPNYGERGTSGFSYPNVFTTGITYTVPTVHMSNGLISRVLNGYRVNDIYQYNSGQPYNPVQPLSSGSLCDVTFNESPNVGSGLDSCRLVLSNSHAPLQSVGVLASGAYTDYATGAAISPTSVHWLVDNVAEAQAVGNPFPGSGRNILRGQPYNNMDASIFKDTKIAERFTLELQMSAYNVLNHQYRGTPISNINEYNGAANTPVDPFLSNAYNGSNQRQFQFAGKIQF